MWRQRVEFYSIQDSYVKNAYTPYIKTVLSFIEIILLLNKWNVNDIRRLNHSKTGFNFFDLLKYSQSADEKRFRYK